MMLKYIDFTDLKLDMLLEILKWRNDVRVRENMFYSKIISETEHLDFIDSLRHDQSKKYYLVSKLRTPVGVVYLTNIGDFKTAEGGLYVNPSYIGQGLGTELLNTLLDISKNRYKLKKLTLSVKKSNKSALRLYQNLGFFIEEEQEGYYITGKVLI